MNCITYNNENSDPDFRSRLWLSETGVKQFLQEARKTDGLLECVLLSTCNRFELYFKACPHAHGLQIRRRIETMTGVKIPPLAEPYLKQGEEAVRHLFQVAAGLRSVMLGENEILGQVKRAYQLACEAGANGFFTNTCFHRAFRCGKRVRQETRLNTGAVGYGAAAAEQARADLGGLQGRQVLLIGTGEMAETLARNLAPQKPACLKIAGRSLDKARKLAAAHQAEAVGWQEISSHLNQAEAVFSATAAPDFVIRPDMLSAVANEGTRYFYDLALPADIDPRTGELPRVVVRPFSELQPAVEDMKMRRENEIPRAERIVEETVADYQNWLKELPAVPAISRLERKTEELREQLVNESGKQPELEQFSRKLTRRLLRSVIKELKSTARAAAEELHKNMEN